MANMTHKEGSLPETTDKDPMVDYVIDQFNMYERHWADKFEQMRTVYDHWNNKPPQREESWQNAVHVPWTLEAEQTITPRLYSALFPNSAPVEVLAEGNEPAENAILIRDSIRHYFRKANVEGKGLHGITQTVLFGTGYGEESWVVEKKWLTDSTSGKRYQATLGGRPEYSQVDFFEIYPHPAKLEVKDGLPLIRRRFCDAEYIKTLAKNPNFEFSKLKEALNSSPVLSPKQWEENKVDFGKKKKDEYEIIEYWGPWHSSYSGDENVSTEEAQQYWVVIVNRTVKVWGKPNPHNFGHPPYIKMKMFEDPKPSWFGVGIGQAGLPTQERINKLVNQRLDNVDLVLNKQGAYNGNDPLINTRKLVKSKPGLWHKVSDTGSSLRWLDTPDVTSSSYKEEEMAKADFRESTGAVNPLMPADQGQHRTAMGLNMLQGAAGMRFRPVLRKMEIDFIQLLAEMFLSDLQQLMTVPEWVEVMSIDGSPEPVLLSPEQIQTKVRFMPSGVSETLNKELQVGQLLRFKELTMDDPTVNRREINKRIAELMGFKDIHVLLTPAQSQGGPLGQEDKMKIQQRIAEGATNEQIEEELFGAGMPERGTPPGQNPQEMSIPTGV